MITCYTELLEAAMLVAKECEKTAPTEADAAGWRRVNRICRKEMYDTRGKIDAVRKKEKSNGN